MKKKKWFQHLVSLTSLELFKECAFVDAGRPHISTLELTCNVLGDSVSFFKSRLFI